MVVLWTYSSGDAGRGGGQDRLCRLGCTYRRHPGQPQPRRAACRPAETGPQDGRGHETVSRQLLQRVSRYLPLYKRLDLVPESEFSNFKKIIFKNIHDFLQSLKLSTILLRFYCVITFD